MNVPRLAGAAAWLALATAAPVCADGVVIVSWQLTDNGDDDGFADTRETVELRLTVRNMMPVLLHDVVLRLGTSSPQIACIGRPLVAVGDLAPDDTLSLEAPFVFTVGDVDRTALGLGAHAAFSARFEVHVESEELAEPAVPQAITIDLDLDVWGGSGPTTFFEGFEFGTFGTFEAHNIDAGLSSLAASDGYRCQYSDPDWSNSNSYGHITDCFLGANAAHASQFYWRINKPTDSNFGKAFSGNYSLYMGIFGATPDVQTTPVSVLEAVRSSAPINLAADEPGSELSYKHQVDLIDSRSVTAPDPGEAVARYVTMLQLADASGNPVGDWIKLEPYLNVYDQTASDEFFNCTFDPIDDGNTEDDFFDPSDPNRRLGPSSTCTPGLSFAYLGETFLPYGDQRWGPLGNADGPGLEGSFGVGTWVESKFNLDRFRGQRVRLRFLNTDLKVNGTNTTWASLFATLNPGPGDDGIWIDDVQVTNTLTQPAIVAPDTHSNLGLPGHADGDTDGLIDACDTCPDVFDPAQTDRDGDGVGDGCDNCIDRINGVQLDSDSDGMGDDCDACPLDDGADDDGDGLACLGDNCPGQPNPQQTDRDADGAGDACDLCPLDPLDDADRDGACAEVDSCPLFHNAEQSNMTRVTSVPFRDDVTDWTFSPDSRTVVYRADRLYAKSLDTGATVDLGPTSGFSLRLQVTPDGARVVYLSAGLYAVPLTGGPPVRLDDRTVHSGPVLDYLISPDSSTVVYRARTDSAIELYSVPIGGGTPVKLNSPLVEYGNVEHSDGYQGTFGQLPYQISPDGGTVVYHADQAEDTIHELYAVPIGGGTAIRLNLNLPPYRSVPSLQNTNSPMPLPATFITSDGAVLYLAENVSAGVELHQVPIGGGAPLKLNRALGSVVRYEVTPDETAVIYSTPTVIDRVPLGGGAPVWIARGGADRLLVSPDGERVVYKSMDGLWSVSATGNASPTQLDVDVPDAYDVYNSVAIAPDSATVVFTTDGGSTLRSVPIEGGPVVVLNESNTGGYEFSADGADVIYATWPPRVSRVPIGGGAAVRLDDPVSCYARNIPPGFRMSPDRSFVTCVGETFGTFDLYAVPVYADPDGDAILSQCDNCPGSDNAGQTDEDLDGLGGTCDNCRFVSNVDQHDADLDGAGDTCDCAPGNPTALPPAEVLGVHATRPAPNVVRLSWQAAAGADVYAVSRVPLSTLGPAEFGPCFDPARAETWIDDATTTQPGVGFGYMIQGVDAVCGSGTLGTASDGTERTNLDPSACP